MTRILGTGEASEPSGRLADLLESLRELRGDLKEIRRDLDDLDERFATFKGRVDKRKQVAARAAEPESDATPAEGPGRHPDVVAILRRRGEG